jgi:transitional endoplasmic reticulum ATPase
MNQSALKRTGTASGGAPWFTKFEKLLVQRRLDQALRLLNDVIESDLPLFDADRSIAADRRVAWLCRIDLLREAGRLTEALAWACLECELNPDNQAAEAVKEELKRLTRFNQNRIDGSPPSPRPSVIRWQGIAGMRELRAELERDVIIPLLNPDLYRRYRVPLPNGILLYGPPGCGKTYIAQVLAKMIEFTFFDVSPSDLASIYVHGTQKAIRALFDKAKDEAPSMLFFDEFDAFVPSRERGVGHHYESEVNEFLTQLNECSERKILVVAATNRSGKIDPAVLRPGRLDKHFFVGPPDLEARVELFRLYTTGRPALGIDYIALGRLSERYTIAEIKEMVNQAARWALEENVEIGQAHLVRALRNRPPSLEAAEVERRRIGFGTDSS